jgi:hypothetical protein
VNSADNICYESPGDQEITGGKDSLQGEIGAAERIIMETAVGEGLEDPDEGGDDEPDDDNMRFRTHLANDQQRTIAMKPISDLSLSVTDATQELVDATEEIYAYSRDVIPLMFK